MIRVNLLPHRAERRKAQRKHLAILAGMVAALAISIVVLVHGVIAGYISIQTDRNEFLKKEIAKLDKEIDEIKKLKEEITALLARKQVIERLQSDRAQPCTCWTSWSARCPTASISRPSSSRASRST